MKRRIIGTFATAIVALLAIIGCMAFSGSTPQYRVVGESGNGPAGMEKVLNDQAKQGWKLHSHQPATGWLIFVKE